MKLVIGIMSLLMMSSVFAGIEWETYSDGALKKAIAKGDKVVLGFHKKGCGTCHAQDSALDKAGITDTKNVTFLKVQRKNSAHTKVYERYGLNSRQWAAIVLLEKGKEVARVQPGITKGKPITEIVERVRSH